MKGTIQATYNSGNNICEAQVTLHESEGDLLKRFIRMRTDFKQSELSKELGYSPASFSKRLHGNAPIEFRDAYYLYQLVGCPDELSFMLQYRGQIRRDPFKIDYRETPPSLFGHVVKRVTTHIYADLDLITDKEHLEQQKDEITLGDIERWANERMAFLTT